MRIGYFKGRFVITADNGMEEIGFKEMQGKFFSTDFLGRTTGHVGGKTGETAGRLYFDEFEPCEHCQKKINARYRS